MTTDINELNTKILNIQIDIANAQSEIMALKSANETRLEILEQYKVQKQLLQELAKEGGEG